MRLVATITPPDATEKTILWSSSDSSVASVSDGKLTALKAGSTTITAKVGEFTATCSVTVDVKATGISLSSTKLTLVKGTTETLVAKVLPEDVTNKDVTWASSDNKIATVKDGAITAVNGGNVVITATSLDGNFKATCNVAVTVPVEGVSLSQTSLSMITGETIQLTETINPSDASNTKVTWSSSDDSVASVNDKGLVTAVKVGTVVISVTTDDGNKVASCTVAVKKSENVGYDPYGDAQKW
ncbi:Ig-like domain-containing protein [Bacteroidaceae bacterium 14-104]|nr:Ig-like domain-containing protein [Phocaeicola oris]